MCNPCHHHTVVNSSSLCCYLWQATLVIVTTLALTKSRSGKSVLMTWVGSQNSHKWTYFYNAYSDENNLRWFHWAKEISSKGVTEVIKTPGTRVTYPRLIGLCVFLRIKFFCALSAGKNKPIEKQWYLIHFYCNKLFEASLTVFSWAEFVNFSHYRFERLFVNGYTMLRLESSCSEY